MSHSDRNALLADFSATGRNHPYLACTLNSLCNLDCVFCKPRCMPDYGHKDHPLSADGYAAIAREAASWKVAKAHCSGGEPTLRRDILDVIAALAAGLGTGSSIGMTTHGNLRRGLTVEHLAGAGLTYLNISLHSLDRGRSAKIMGGGDPDQARDTVNAALSLQLKVKINCVVQRSYLHDAIQVAHLAKDLPVAVRLIELQNIGPASAIFDTEFIPEAEVRPHVQRWLGDAGQVSRADLGVRSPGEYLRPEGWAGSIGFISNSSCATCSDANRIKITPSGVARPCILHNRDIALKPHLADGTLNEAFAHLFRAMLGRDDNPAWQGFHYVDYDLRWDRMERPFGAPVMLPVLSAGSCSSRTGLGEAP
ncbi:radical SAM protein [Nonomuraea glycinis]|uniref:Cyclic pyranopterin phosphate synthase n=1 Tax=Nonomuraea glycinis TaxID=2047744 RepID=A0A918ABB8_9ACTN|nr:GTP 3',8-cyclase MoaA [Nonomuraea glycinis]MCA2178459.1 radical SAM protein [Nonomuraea glycinis]GGP14174.1 cyclic pyranopterin phosphate synthase [Nonomuraea glycinis]